MGGSRGDIGDVPQALRGDRQRLALAALAMTMEPARLDLEAAQENGERLQELVHAHGSRDTGEVSAQERAEVLEGPHVVAIFADTCDGVIDHALQRFDEHALKGAPFGVESLGGRRAVERGGARRVVRVRKTRTHLHREPFEPRKSGLVWRAAMGFAKCRGEALDPRPREPARNEKPRSARG